MKYPEYLYHYTTIECLALILSNKSIRFSSISHLDDTIEGNSNIGPAYHYALVSCLTDQNEENISLWNMYCNNGKGVRIRMRPTLFHEEINHLTDKYFMIENQNLFYSKNFLYKNDYVDNPEAFIRNIIIAENGTVNHQIMHGSIGRQKKKIWKFQNEWRFIIFQMPNHEARELILNPQNETKEIMKPESFKNKFYDLKIQNTEMKHMEITLGPKTTISERIIVQALIEKYNPDTKINSSKLQGKWR